MTDTENREDVQDDEAIGRALKASAFVMAVIAVLVIGGFLTQYFIKNNQVDNTETEIIQVQERETLEIEAPMVPFADVTAEAGIEWIHESGMEGEKLLPETMGGGVAFLDYDRDGDEDLLFVGGKSWDWSDKPNPDPQSLCLFQNDGSGNFRDVTSETGLDVQLYGMAPAVADVDNDGWPDLFVSAVGNNRFFKNVEGKFVDATEQSGLAGEDNAWSSGAVWFDFDNDGLLDLFVSDYVVWNRDLDLSLGFKLTGVGRAYGQPTSFTGTQSHLYHNEGNSQFADVSEAMGIHVSNSNTGVPVGKGLGVAAIDVDQDGWQDILVANDTVQNFLFLNVDGESFMEMGISMGVAFDRSGNATGAMGVDCGYIRNDDSLSIAIGNFANEQSSLYMTSGPTPPFTDQALVTGLGPMSRLNLTFGMCFADLDLDSRLDLFCANGHLEEEISKVQSTQRYEQPPQFFWNAGKGGSSEFIALDEGKTGAAALEPLVGRGAACGDLDNDGDLDVVIVGNSGPPRLLRNDQSLEHKWIRILPVGSKSNRDGIGAKVSIRLGDQTLRQNVVSTRSYLSQSSRAVTFGLGDAELGGTVAVHVAWPSGLSEIFELPVNASHQVTEGEGSVQP